MEIRRSIMIRGNGDDARLPSRSRSLAAAPGNPAPGNEQRLIRVTSKNDVHSLSLFVFSSTSLYAHALFLSLSPKYRYLANRPAR